MPPCYLAIVCVLGSCEWTLTLALVLPLMGRVCLAGGKDVSDAPGAEGDVTVLSSHEEEKGSDNPSCARVAAVVRCSPRAKGL